MSSILFFRFMLNAFADINEDTLFSDTATVISRISIRDNTAVPAKKEHRNLGISGIVTGVVSDNVLQHYSRQTLVTHDKFSAWIIGDLELDARLSQGFKAYGTMEVQYRPLKKGATDTSTRFFLPELFIDANIKRKVYFRMGKQVLQWGRCYLWNPTDLINIEKNTFERKIGLREGTYGLKIHIPFGTVVNIYGFAGAYNATEVDSLSGAAKLEVLIKNTEMAVSIWSKNGFGQVYGYDVSTQIFGIDINGEIALHEYLNLNTVSFGSDLPQIVPEHKRWTPRIALNLGRTFKVGGVPDRLHTIMEFYYNNAGNPLKTIPIEKLETLWNNDTAGLPVNLIDYVISKGLYEPNSFSRFYGAMFVSLAKFPMPTMEVSLSALSNFNEQCAIISGAITYQNLNGFSLEAIVYGYIGPKNTEYYFSDYTGLVQVLAKIVF